MNNGFSVIRRNGVTLISVDCINNTGKFQAYYSTGLDGVSSLAGGCTMNLSIFKGIDTQENVVENFTRFADAACIPGGYRRLVAQREKHIPKVVSVGIADVKQDFFDISSYQFADGQVTKDNIPLFVYASDCATMLLCDPVTGIYATTHCGWRNSLNHTITNWIEKFVEMGGHTESALVAIGPSICQNCFEVDDDVRNLFLAYDSDFERWMYRKGSKTHIDLCSINRELLVQEGIPMGNIYESGICNCEELCLPSYRRDKGGNGAIGGVIYRIS